MVGQLGAVFGGGGGEEAFGQPVGGLQAVQKVAAEIGVGLAAEGSDAGHAFGRVRHGVGLLITHHLQAVFDLAVGKVKLGQVVSHGLGNPILCRQGLQPAQCCAVTKRWVAPPGDQLAGLGEELDLADAALAEFHVVVFDGEATVQPAMFADAQAHVMGVLDGGEIKVFAPDKGGQRFEEPIPRRDIAAAGAGLDIGGAFPRTALGLVIAVGGGHGQADGRHAGIGAQAQVGAKDISTCHGVAEKARHFAGDADKGGAGLLPVVGITILIEEADEVDVGGIVQLSRAHLAHGKRHHAACGLRVIGAGAGQFAAADFIGDKAFQAKINGMIGQIGQGGCDLHGAPDPTQIGKRGQEGGPTLGLAQGGAQLVQRHILQPGHQGCKGLLRGDRQSGAQPVGLALHQIGQIGAAARRCGQQAGDFRRKVSKARGNLGSGAGIKGNGLARQARGEGLGHAPIMRGWAARSTACAPPCAAKAMRQVGAEGFDNVAPWLWIAQCCPKRKDPDVQITCPRHRRLAGGRHRRHPLGDAGGNPDRRTGGRRGGMCLGSDRQVDPVSGPEREALFVSDRRGQSGGRGQGQRPCGRGFGAGRCGHCANGDRICHWRGRTHWTFDGIANLD